MLKIKQEISENRAGWHQAKQVMDIIYKKTGVKYHEVYLQAASQMGLFYKGTYEKICKHVLKRERGLQKGIQKEILANPKRIQYNSITRG